MGVKARLRLLALLNAFFLLGAFACGDEDGGGCGPAPAKKEEQQSAGGGGGGAPHGGGGRAPELITQDKKGRVPKAYQRPGAYDKEDARENRDLHKPVIAKSTAPVAMPLARIPVKITKRKMDGVADRVELTCKILPISDDGKCAGAKNYLEIKERCCPGGLVERCDASPEGVTIVGRGCEPAP